MSRKSVKQTITVDELLWIIHEAVREGLGTHVSPILAILPHAKHGWVVAHPRKGRALSEKAASLIDNLEIELRREYTVSFAG